MSNNDKQAKQDSTAGKAADDSRQLQGAGGGDKVAGGSGPGSDNPALAETYAEESGDISTADFLLAREFAEEERLRQERAQIYADQARSQDPEGTADGTQYERRTAAGWRARPGSVYGCPSCRVPCLGAAPGRASG